MKKPALIIATISLFVSLTSPISANAAACALTETTSGGYKFVAFKTTGTCTWSVPTGVTKVDVLVVAGGGGGAGGSSGAGGGGGAGGLVEMTDQSLPANGVIDITVGVGGGAGTSTGTNGGDSIAVLGSTLTAEGGGGGGGGYSPTATKGEDGGSGGGGGGVANLPIATGGAGTSLQGNSGGSGSQNYSGGGGGGAGGIGGPGSSTNGGISGAGGAGKTITWITKTVAVSLGVGDSSSTSAVFASGGGGSGYGSQSYAAAKTLGGGGEGGTSNNGQTGTAGMANTGGGGGGGFNMPGSSGGSGVVVLRFSEFITPSTTITAPTTALSGDTASVTAATNSTGALTLASSTTGICTVTGAISATDAGTTTVTATINFLTSGSCAITASTPANGNYSASTASKTIAVSLKTAVISFTNPPTTGAVGSNTTIAATVNSGAAVTYAIDGASSGICSLTGSTQVNYLAPGNCIINASSIATTTYTSATSSVTISVNFPECVPATITNGGYTYFAFKTTVECNWAIPAGVSSLDVLAVGGGGGGGSRHSSGGGAGGLVASSGLSVSGVTKLEIKVGTGGVGGTNGSSGTTGNSTIVKLKNGDVLTSTITAHPGGGGGVSTAGTYGSSGGLYSGTPAAVTGGQGNKGGVGQYWYDGNYGGGGGGGAGAVGGTGTISSAKGGIGKTVPFIDSTVGAALVVGQVSSGALYFAGGGGAGWATPSGYSGPGAAGGLGGGGKGGAANLGYTASIGTAGSSNTGGGGGGSGLSGSNAPGGDGGSGVVVVRFALTYTVSYKVDSMTASAFVENFTASSPAKIKGNGESGINFTKTGFSLTGWSTTENGAKAYSVGQSYSTAANLILYPVWTAASALCVPEMTSTSTYDIYTFDKSKVADGCVWQVPTGVSTLDVLVVGGGGGYGSGGGGSGGFLEKTGYVVTAGAYIDVNVGVGGAGSAGADFRGSEGGSSRFGNLEAGGGGGGGRATSTVASGGNASATNFYSDTTEFVRGSGGGGSSSSGSYGAGIGRFNGGATVSSTGTRGGGGGGSSQAGFAGNSTTSAGVGGAGTKSAITSLLYASGGSAAGAASNSNAINQPGSGGGNNNASQSGIVVVRAISSSLFVCDVNYGELNFDYAKAVNQVGTGKSLNDKVLFKEVLPVDRCGGVDAVVTTSAISNGKIVNYESGARAGGENSFFQVDADITASNGYVEFTFSFYVKDTYNTTSRSVILQNVKVTAIDIDAYQFNYLSNFDSYTLAKATRLKASPVPTAFPASATFQGPAGSDSNSPLDQVVATYGQVENFSVRFGRSTSGTPNYYGVAFKELGWGTAAPQTVGTEYTLTYSENGGTGTTPTSATAGVGGAVVVAGNIGPVTKSGSTFLGWNTNATGSGTTYAAGSTFLMPLNGATLYALWSPVTYAVSYSANGATSGTVPDQESANSGQTVTVSANTGTLQRTGYALSGWSQLPSGTSPITLGTGTFTMPGNNVVLYAVWTPQSQTITYNANNTALNPVCTAGSGTVPSSPSSALTGSTYTIPDNTGNLSCGNYVFTGWNTAANGSGTDYAPGTIATMGTNGITLYAQWAQLFLLTYNANSGTGAPASTTGTSGQTILVSTETNTVRTGFTFSGWNTKADGTGTTLGASFTMPSDNVTVYAQWTPKKRSVLYNTNGGTGAPDSALINSGATYTISSTIPSKSGYSFVSWNTKIDGSGSGYVSGDQLTLSSVDVVLYAQWTAIPFTLTYAANGGVGNEPDGEIGFIGDSSRVSEPSSLSRSGYTFTGWNTVANGSGTGYTPGSILLMPGADVLLYAQWSANPYSIKYNGNGATSGTGPTGSTGYTDQTLNTTSVPGSWVRTGYTFTGWSTIPTDESFVAAGNSFIMPPNEVVWYAQWSANQYTLTYDANSGAGVPATQNERTNSLVTLSGTIPSRAGYTFTGWNTVSDGTGTGYDSAGTLTMPASDLILYAQWIGNQNSLIYNANGGAGAPAAKAATTGSSVSVDATKPTRTGYTFVDWFEDAAGTGSKVSGPFTMPPNNKTLYAKWAPVNYTLTYNANSGTAGPSNATHAMDSIAAISKTVPTRAGFNFLGWNTAADGSGIAYIANDNLEIVGNVTVYAQWLANSYIFSYSANGGQGAPASVTVATGETLTVSSAEPTRNGYVFGGWLLDKNDSMTVLSTEYTMPANNVIAYAKWTAADYDVTYNLAGGNGTFNSAKHKTDNVVNISSSVPTREGYTFLGWGTSQRSIRSTLTPGGKFTMPASNVSLYAQWVGDPLDIEFDVNQGSGGPSNFQQAVGSEASVSNTVPSRGGFTFSHWIDADTNERVNPGNSFAMPARKVRLIAQWSANPVVNPIGPQPKPTPVTPPKPVTPPTPRPILAPPSRPVAPAVLQPPVRPSIQVKPAAPINAVAPAVVRNTPTVTTAPAEVIEIRQVTVQTTPTSYGVQISGQDWSITITSTKQLQQGSAAENTGKIQIEAGNTVTTFGTGFKPNSQVDVYVYSTPIWLGSTIADAQGNYVVTLPMPKSLPIGDHVFQAQGKTFDDVDRTANVPITLVPAALPSKASLSFEVFYPMNSFALDAKARAVITKAYKSVKARLTSKSVVTVNIVGWVQPTVKSPNINGLSTGRAKAVQNYLKKLGLKAKFTLKTPGHDKVNVAQSRRATAVISWTNPKS